MKWSVRMSQRGQLPWLLDRPHWSNAHLPSSSMTTPMPLKSSDRPKRGRSWHLSLIDLQWRERRRSVRQTWSMNYKCSRERTKKTVTRSLKKIDEEILSWKILPNRQSSIHRWESFLEKASGEVLITTAVEVFTCLTSPMLTYQGELLSKCRARNHSVQLDLFHESRDRVETELILLADLLTWKLYPNWRQRTSLV